jgi:hypothetical protein
MNTACINTECLPQFTATAKTLIGVEMLLEMLLIYSITDADGSLKIQRSEGFTDSNEYLDFYQAVAEAKADKKHSGTPAA